MLRAVLPLPLRRRRVDVGVMPCVLHVAPLKPTQYASSYVMLCVTDTALDSDAEARRHES